MEIRIMGSPSPAPAAPRVNPSRSPERPNPKGDLMGAAAPREHAETKPSPQAPRITTTRAEIMYDETINRVIGRIVDEETGETIHEVPPEELRRLYAAIREMVGPLVDESA